jgi:thiol peroxidase
MTLEREALIAFGGIDQTVVGPDLETGQQAPGFTAIANDWSEVDPVADYSGKVRVLLALPSLETSVCDRETRTFNERAAGLDGDVHVFAISHDLPLTQKRWCAAAGVERVMTLSDHALGDFGPKYGVLMKEMRLLRRAAFVIDRDGKLSYVEYLPENGMEPDYDAVLEAARQAL